jgi:hypothetical protein
MNPRDIGLPPISPGEIDDELRSISLEAALMLLGRMADYADRFAGSADGQARVAETFLPPSLSVPAKAECRRSGRIVFSAQMALLLARRALGTCPQSDDTEWNDERLTLTAWTLGVLALGLAGSLDVAEAPEESALDISRAQVFSTSTSRWAYADAHEVLFTALPALPGAPDLDKVVHARYDVSFRSLWAVTALAGIAFANEHSDIVQPMLNVINPQLKQAFLELWSVRPQDAAAAWASSDVMVTPWDLSAFYKKPLVDFGPQGPYANVYTPIRTAFMVAKGELGEALWIAADLLPGKERLTLLSYVGKAFEAVARHRIEARFDKFRLLTENELKQLKGSSNKGGVCDLVVLYPTEWVAIEIVRHSFTKKTLTVGNYNDLMKDLGEAVVEKLKQIDDTISRLLIDDSLDKPSRVFPIVVVGGQLAVNPLTWRAILSAFAQEQPKFVTVDARCMRPVILDLVDLRLALDACSLFGKTLPEILGAFVTSPLATMPFGFWLSSAYPRIVTRGDVANPRWVMDAKEWMGLSQGSA